jgi:peptidoglycan/xylan/chitin deacetylase (PgdA/CDA1 family)
MGILPRISALLPEHLSVLLYHRIDDRRRPDFYGEGGLCVTPARFAEQLDYLVTNYSVVSLEQCISWISYGARLPERPVLITFDDGYRDNFLNALPALVTRRLSAVVFVATGFVGDAAAFYWDWVTDAFVHASCRGRLKVPLLGQCTLADVESRSSAARAWIMAAKGLSDSERRQSLHKLSLALGIAQSNPPQGTQATWDDLRQMTTMGVTLGAHTVSHPILSRISASEAENEITLSLAEIKKETGQVVRSFAYPNGLRGDFLPIHQAILRDRGIAVGFASYGGTTFSSEVRRHPFAVRRIVVGDRDSLPRFAAKLAGLTRVASSVSDVTHPVHEFIDRLLRG